MHTRRGLLDRLHGNDPSLAAELLEDPVIRRRNRVALDWSGARRPDIGEPDDPGDAALDVVVRTRCGYPCGRCD